MLNYRIQVSTGQTNILIPLSMDNNVKNHDNIDDLATDVATNSVNPIINYEMEGYEPTGMYKLIFNFWNGAGYSTDWSAAGFDFPTEIDRNVFKKSAFLLEFYDSNTPNNNLIFNTSLSVYPNTKTGKGCDSIIIGTAQTLYTTYTVTQESNEAFLLFYKRNFNTLNNINVDGNGVRFVTIYMKAMFLNAKTGNVQYFLNNPNIGSVSNDSFSQSLYYFELRMYENYFYSFYNNGLALNNINLSEIVINND